jgi:hypothetical protein
LADGTVDPISVFLDKALAPGRNLRLEGALISRILGCACNPCHLLPVLSNHFVLKMNWGTTAGRVGRRGTPPTTTVDHGLKCVRTHFVCLQEGFGLLPE